jgi:DUF4097 and DUF4098 domain-containing protein YvlB
MKRIIPFLLAAIFMLTLHAIAQHRRGEDLVKTKSFTVKKGGLLKVSVNGGDIRIVPWERNEVLVNVRGADEDDFDGLSMMSDGNDVRIDNQAGYGYMGNVRFEINVPSQFDIDLRTTMGTIEIEESLTGKVRGSTLAGDILLGNINGQVDLNTSGGDIRTADIKGNLNAKTSGGDIKVGTVSGETDVNTSGGNIRIGDVKKTLWATTSGGDIVIGDVGGEATVTTSGGNISVGKVSGSVKLTTAGGDIDLQAASGSVRARTAGGNIRLLAITGSVDAKTAGGDVEAELIPGGKGGSRLVTASGAIILYVPTGAKATIDAHIRIQGGWRYQKDDYQIHSAFPETIYEANKEEREMHGQYIINGGGETITLETVNADIEIRKLGDRSHE